ncbi:MAG: gliding motility-associated C-terminal domain-containing protein [Lewinellaceae bacterium]|nr:gliding motility-associated C-terminal domain-containing protein [Lewinellaceae bacterium]
MQVYDRWGSLVFQNLNLKPNDLTAGWDGSHRGESLLPAVFSWWAEIELVNGETRLLSGDLTIVR